MAVQYIPQFIPTNTQALQGVLSEYQRAYDANLERELAIQDQYSAIPTLNAADTIRKNEILGSFSNTLSDIEKKHNYDRSSTAYSKELARKISELRKNDFWTYNERKKQLVQAEQEAKQRLGASYISQYSPSQATYEDQTALNNYQPMSTDDLYKIVFNKGKEVATANRTPINTEIMYKGVPIAIERGFQQGYGTPEEVDAFLNTDKGKEFLRSSIEAAGFSNVVDDPRVLGMAMDAARASLIGERNTEKYSIPSEFFKKDKPSFPTSTGVKRTLPNEVSEVGATGASQAMWKESAKFPLTPQEKEIAKDGFTSHLLGQGLGLGRFGEVLGKLQVGFRTLIGVAAGMSSKRDEANPDNDVYTYLYAKALTPDPENAADMNTYNTGLSIAREALNEYGISDVTPEELYMTANAVSMSRGEKNSINKALEALTGKDLRKYAGGREVGRKWNTWWESGGNTNKDKYQRLLKGREQSWTTSIDNFMVEEGDQNRLGDWMASLSSYSQPYFTGLSEADGDTKGYVRNENMQYFRDDKLQDFFADKGNYRVQRSMSGDDAPFITLINPAGKRINFTFPIDRFESLDDIYITSARFGNLGFGNDLILSKFNVKAGNIIDSASNDMKIALLDRMKYKAMIGTATYDENSGKTALTNIDNFFSTYDIRKTENSMYQVRKKEGSWTTKEFTKEELFELFEKASNL